METLDLAYVCSTLGLAWAVQELWTLSKNWHFVRSADANPPCQWRSVHGDGVQSLGCGRAAAALGAGKAGGSGWCRGSRGAGREARVVRRAWAGVGTTARPGGGEGAPLVL